MTGGSSVALDGFFTTTDFTRIPVDISFANGVGVSMSCRILFTSTCKEKSYMGLSVHDLMHLAVHL